jgi:hypothetical protein
LDGADFVDQFRNSLANFLKVHTVRIS